MCWISFSLDKGRRKQQGKVFLLWWKSASVFSCCQHTNPAHVFSGRLSSCDVSTVDSDYPTRRYSFFCFGTHFPSCWSFPLTVIKANNPESPTIVCLSTSEQKRVSEKVCHSSCSFTCRAFPLFCSCSMIHSDSKQPSIYIDGKQWSEVIKVKNNFPVN